MPKIEFKIDWEKDARNYYDCANSNPHFGVDFTKEIKPEIFVKFRGKKWTDVKNEILITLKKAYHKDNVILNKKKREIEKEWGKIKQTFFAKLEQITKHKIYTNKFVCYFTTLGRCPYNDKENWFMTNIF